MPKSEDLLLEYRQDGRKTWAVRFYLDGLVEEFSDSKMEYKRGKFTTHPIPLAWRVLTHLSPTELEKVVAALRRSDFLSLPEKLGDSTRVMDGTLSTWTVILDGQQKVVRATGAEATHYPAIKLLREMVQEVTADAFNREADEEKLRKKDARSSKKKTV